VSAQHWQRIEGLFEELTALPREQRAQFLDDTCGTNVELRAELESLLRAHETGGGLLDSPPAAMTDPSFGADTSAPHAPAPGAQPGARVGPYQLIRQIGEGGMAAVWLAERAEGGVQRKVALKLPHWSWILPDLIVRMARERDILAALEHPNIARLYDAGVDQLGRPYLAMELVEGKPIDVFCRERALSIPACLQLVLQVARGVAFAHSRLVVHRDLKPNNILVADDGSVHLLDFGIAKLLAGDTAKSTHLTQLSGRALTLDYAAPEHVKGEPVGTSADVYSLAVVTYELVTGSRPYRLTGTTAAELERAITTAQPRLASEATTDRARSRALRGDLDAILNHALKKDPAERYPTVDAFAQDIERALRGEPVRARPDSTLYRFRKFASRNRLALGVAGALAAVLIVATSVSLWQARVAEQERNRALRLLARNEAINEFVGTMLTQAASPDRSLSLDAVLERSESLVSAGMASNPEHRAVILQMLAGYYGAFGNRGKTESLLRQALTLARGSDDAELLATIECLHAFAESELGAVAQAQKTIDGVLATAALSPTAAAVCLDRRSVLAQNTNDAPGALDYAQHAQAQLAKAERVDPAFAASTLGNLAYAHHLNGHALAAENAFSQSLARYTAIGRAEHPNAIATREQWALSRFTTGDVVGALALFDEALNLAGKHAVADELPLSLLADRALALDALARYDEARAAYDRVISVGEQRKDPSAVAFALVGKAKTSLAAGQIEEAQQLLDRALGLQGDAIPPDSSTSLNAQVVHARLAAARGSLSQAETEFSHLVAFWDSRKVVTGATWSALRDRADVYLRQGKLDAAAGDARRALGIAQSVQGDRPYSSMTGLTLSLLSRIDLQAGRKVQAHQEATQALAHLSRGLGASHPETQRARELISG
jgi:serine/threonine-protein kinase